MTAIVSQRPTALVLSGGNALGAFHAGVFEALADAKIEPAHVAGSSTGAVTAGIIAGNRPEERLPRLREFWRRATIPDNFWDIEVPGWGGPLHLARAVQGRILGRPALFALRLFPGVIPGIPRRSTEVSLYDFGPLRQTLRQLIDVERLNDGGMRLSVMTVDLETGDEVVFDTRRERVEIDHLLASAGLIPDFPASEIGGRVLGDGGLSANTPVGVALAEAPRDLVCIASDCFPRVAPRPGSWLEASERQGDLLFANQTRKAIEAASHCYALRRQVSDLLDALPASLRAREELRPLTAFRDPGNVDVLRIEYRPTPDEIGMKGFDFSVPVTERRWRAGKSSMETALETLSRLPRTSGLRVTEV